MKLLRCCFVLACAAPWLAYPMFLQPVDMPVRRVMENALAQVKKDTKDAKAHYVYARINSYAYTFGTEKIKMIDTRTNELAFSISDLRYEGGEDGRLARIGHLMTALSEYKVAMDLPSKSDVWNFDGLPNLGLAWSMEQASQVADKLEYVSGVTDKLQSRKWWLDSALKLYRSVYKNQKALDIKKEGAFKLPNTFLGMEAGQRILVLVEKDKVGTFGKGEKEDIEAHIKKVSAFREVGVTPIVVTLGVDDPSSLINQNSKVKFDLLGGGVKSESGWVTPSAGLLCWDPEESGKITSGTQLFGTGTFWMFFGNGFDAMSYLDDNHDGWLSGHELDGICLWHDADGDGVSNKREVRPVAEWGIKSLKWRGYRAGSLGYENAGAVVWLDGHVTSLYDWVTQGK